MNLYLRVLSYVKPYRLMVALSLLSSILFVLLNAFSFWMISSLISTIMNPRIRDSQLPHQAPQSPKEAMPLLQGTDAEPQQKGTRRRDYSATR